MREIERLENPRPAIQTREKIRGSKLMDWLINQSLRLRYDVVPSVSGIGVLRKSLPNLRPVKVQVD
ncbi:MAG TPA: hypothetical protein VHJ19_02295 [Gammaproteobacteria bacterium]|nr:hypothetical protein [Gammaproteobacteria bacterium]